MFKPKYRINKVLSIPWFYILNQERFVNIFISFISILMLQIFI